MHPQFELSKLKYAHLLDRNYVSSVNRSVLRFGRARSHELILIIEAHGAHEVPMTRIKLCRNERRALMVKCKEIAEVILTWCD